MNITIAIRCTRTNLLEGFCDLYLYKDQKLSLFQVEKIVQICEKMILNRIGNNIPIGDVLFEIREATDAHVELDLNLQQYGSNQFGCHAHRPILHFLRHDTPWPDNGFDYDSTSPYALYQFLTFPPYTKFTIGIVEKKSNMAETVCDVMVARDFVEKMDYSKMIEVLDVLRNNPEKSSIYVLSAQLQVITNGIIRCDRLDKKTIGKGMVGEIGLLFIRGWGNSQSQFEYEGEVTALKGFLMN